MNKEWPLCGRYVHLSGGLGAINAPGSNIVKVESIPSSSESISFSINNYGDLYSEIIKLNFNIIGIEFIHDNKVISGENPAEWRSYSDQADCWKNSDAQQRWAQLSISSVHNKNGLCYDLSSRIRYQLESANQRLKELSNSYHDQLKSIVLSDKIPKQNRRLQNGFTDIVYQRFQTFLFDICILRDYLSEFLYHYSRNGELHIDRKVITTAGGLFKLLKSSTTRTELECKFFEIMSEHGWLKELGAYRDLVMHSAPINIANHRLYCIEESITTISNDKIRSIRFPIHGNPDEVFKKRANRNNFEQYFNEMKLIAQATAMEHGKYDCLDYACSALQNMSNLALEVATIAPIKPMMQCLIKTPTGIISRFEEIS